MDVLTFGTHLPLFWPVFFTPRRASFPQ